MKKIFTELDNIITEKEISASLCSLKNKKSSSFDLILNEMLKSGQNILMPCFKKNYLSGNFPQIWAKGFIVPLFKSGSRDDLANYRGITISSCLGKLFTKILKHSFRKFR